MGRINLQEQLGTTIDLPDLRKARIMNNQSDPLISVGMPFYNAASTLSQAIRSVLAQTYQNWELILWDDGSTDGSLEIARSFCGDHRIRLHSDMHNLALSLRLNTCLDQAHGDYFARMDADDIAYPQRFEKQMRFMQANPGIDLISTFVTVIDEEGKAYGKMTSPTRHEDIARRALLGIRMFHPTWFGRISWFRHYRYKTDALLVEDIDLLFRAHKDSRYAVMPEMLLAYRQGKPALSKLMRHRWLFFSNFRRYLKGPKGLLWQAWIGAVTLLKASVECTAVLTGLNYRLLRHRAEPMTENEKKAVNHFLHVVNDVNS